jgi:hypothetical protein
MMAPVAHDFHIIVTPPQKDIPSVAPRERCGFAARHATFQPAPGVLHSRERARLDSAVAAPDRRGKGAVTERSFWPDILAPSPPGDPEATRAPVTTPWPPPL